MSEDPFDSPPIQETGQEEHVESEPNEGESDLIHVELGEAVAARQPQAPPTKRHRKPSAQSKRAGLAFLHLENLPSDKGSGNAPLMVWIIVQLAAIAAAAARWKFWAKAGVGDAPSLELLALHTLLVVQLVVSTLIYPILLDSWAKLAWAASAAIAFDAIAWVMTDVAPLAALWGCGFVVIWIAGLAIWRAAAPGAFFTMVIRLSLALLVLGWPIVVYLHSEFAIDSNGTFAGAGGGGPIPAALAQLDSMRLAFETWAMLLSLAGSGGMVWLATRLTRFRRSRAGEST